MPSPPEHRLLAFSHGTRVTVRDLFGNMPVRVKQRALDAERGVHGKDWEDLKRVLVSLLLSWPYQVSVHLRDTRYHQSISIRCAEPTTNRHGKGDAQAAVFRVSGILQQAQLSNDVASESWVPLQASVGNMSVTGATSLIPVATRRVQFISIGIQPLSNEHGSNVLYEEINRLFTNSSFGVEEDASEIDEEEQKRRAADRRHKTDGYTGRELKARKGVDRWPMFYIKLSLEAHGAQSAGPDVDEVLDERHGSLNAIVDLLKAVFYEFLKRYHFRPRHFRPRKNVSLRKSESSTPLSRISTPGATSDDSTSLPQQTRTAPGDLATTRLNLRHIPPTSNSLPRTESPFESWTRVKSGRPHNLAIHIKATASPGPSVGASGQPENELPQEPDVRIDISSHDSSGTPISDADFGESTQSAQEAEYSTDENIIWTDPVTKKRTLIDSRTGFVKPRQETPNSRAGSGRSPKKLRLPGKPNPASEKSPWLEDVLASWENPVFQHAEPPIPIAFDEIKTFEPSSCHGTHSSAWLDPTHTNSIQGKISKEALRHAEFIAQVDRKFILAKISMAGSNGDGGAVAEGPNTSLVIIDQHAADERCRVEALFDDYFEVVDPSSLQDGEVPVSTQRGTTVRARTEVLERPLQFDISNTDARQLTVTADHFRKWGIWYEVDAPPAAGGPSKHRRSAGPSQVKVRSLPPSIAERCRVEPRLLVDLLRKEAWKAADEHEHGPPRPSDHHNHHHPLSLPSGPSTGGPGPGPRWPARLHGCPRAVVDMVNSRACRGAVMFNDALSRDECVRLLARLADCAFPFQCAHGRPSMVPLLDLGSGAAGSGGVERGGLGADVVGRDEGRLSFGKAFRRWKAVGEARST